MSKISKLIGNRGEQIAVEFLLRQGVQILTRNFYSRFGEIDIIAHDGTDTIFVEVKQRKQGINTGIESITHKKQNKLIRTAQYYLLKHNKADILCRFDAIIIASDGEINWLKNIINQ